jgi:SRSO17 transposase
MEGEADNQTEQGLSTVQSWADGLWEVEQRVGRYFGRREVRQEGMNYLRGLLSPVERKNSWQLAEALGEATPYRLQHLLGRALWEAEEVRDELQGYVVDHLAEGGAILVVDETGFLKKGRHSAGVARQYSGTAGRIENCQIGVFLSYVSRRGHTLIDRELYLPKEWSDDRTRCRQAGIPEERSFATKPLLARQMLERAFATGVTAEWVTADSVYGDDRRLRLWLEERPQGYVLAVSGKEHVWMGFEQRSIKSLLATLPTAGWQRLSAGDGAKGPRIYDWLLMPLNQSLQEGWRRWLLVRRKIETPAELTAFIAFAPQETELETLVQVAGSRWAIEVTLEAAKGEVGLDHYEVRSWTGWYRHITLAMWAHAFLTVIRAAALDEEGLKKGALLPNPSPSLTDFKRSRGLLSA